MAKLMKAGRFFVVSNKVAKFKDEIYQYVWNERSGEPVKEHDDVLDAVRYAIYSLLRSRRDKKNIKERMTSAQYYF